MQVRFPERTGQTLGQPEEEHDPAVHGRCPCNQEKFLLWDLMLNGEALIVASQSCCSQRGLLLWRTQTCYSKKDLLLWRSQRNVMGYVDSGMGAGHVQVYSRLRCVERVGAVTNVLSAVKHSVGQTSQEVSGGKVTCYWSHSETRPLWKKRDMHDILLLSKR